MVNRWFTWGFAASIVLCMGALAPVSIANAKDAPQMVQEDAKPLLIIRFNQEHVYFSRALKQAVLNAEAAKPGVIYKIISVVPASSHKGESKLSAEQAKANLASVTNMIKEICIQPERVQTTTRNASSVSAQEIRIYVE